MSTTELKPVTTISELNITEKYVFIHDDESVTSPFWFDTEYNPWWHDHVFVCYYDDGSSETITFDSMRLEIREERVYHA